ncbi:RHS repeat-associated core domain-containing protein [Dyella sp.]|uniref:RHS repeat-associated core domain-containing protein n=1 Tax=Dyella sp. TaxID=1869338 RepID=UPI00283E131A|nr:RHS repeat-associated core domain-containing protein [Dyella sp.]MDR3446262.1 RHS repeat-associated core domain-containing protein [Dyella sp.]
MRLFRTGTLKTSFIRRGAALSVTLVNVALFLIATLLSLPSYAQEDVHYMITPSSMAQEDCLQSANYDPATYTVVSLCAPAIDPTNGVQGYLWSYFNTSMGAADTSHWYYDFSPSQPQLSCSSPNHSPNYPCANYTPAKNLGCGCPKVANKPKAGDPINIATGNMYTQQEDFVAGDLSLSRYYNSDSYTRGSHAGASWLMSYDRHLSFTWASSNANGNPLSPTQVALQRQDGQELIFKKINGAWQGDTDVNDLLTEVDDSNGYVLSWTLLVANTRLYEIYSPTGLLLSINDGTHALLSLSYTDGTQKTATGFPVATGLLWRVSDARGRTLTFTYGNPQNIASVTEPDGSILEYVYNGFGELTSVTYPDGSQRQYLYDESAYSSAGLYQAKLTGIIDEASSRYTTFVYQADGRATSTQEGAGANRHTFSYTLPYTSNQGTATTVTYPLGQTATATIVAPQGTAIISAMSARCGEQCDQQYQSQTLDTNGNPDVATDFNGNIKRTIYSASGLLSQQIDAGGTANQRTTNFTWNIGLRVPLNRTVLDSSGGVVAYDAWTYNNAGQVTARCKANPNVPGSLSYSCGSSTNAPSGVRQSLSTYCTAIDTTQCPLVGLLLSVDDPRTDVSDLTHYSYYLATDESGCGTAGGACHRAGDLYQITNALGQTITYAAYDKNGRVVRQSDNNDVITDLTYSPRGWLLTRTVRANADGSPSSSDAITTIGYTPYGTVASITDADNVTMSYTYDAAHRLTDITDALGDRIHYTLDAAGNKTQEQTFDPSGTVRRTLSRTYNTLGQLTQVTDGLNHAVFNASYADSYDANGNLVHTADALGVQRKQGYDGLNRLVQTIDNYNGTDTATQNTQSVFAYDANDRLEGVSDPDGLNTTYSYDGLGNATGVQSPDTGSTSYLYDAAGNVTQRTDARGVVSHSTYDALNRRTATTYTDGTLNVAYGYDEPNSVTGCSASYPVGRLTRIVETAVTTVYCYDAHGNVTRKSQTQGTATDSTTYSYTLADRLASTLTPSGTSVQYSHDDAGRINGVTALPPGTSGAGAGNVVTNVSYLPFGPIASYTLGNGQTITHTYDANYALTDVVSPALNLHFARDAMGNITALGNAPGANPATESYSYDPLYRLTGLTNGNGNVEEAYTYSKTGDRLSKTASGLATGVYTYQAGTHHLAAIGNAARAYDANGNTTGSVVGGDTFGFGYNGRNRMTIAQRDGSTVGTYTYNALGQRTKVVTFPAASSQRFTYDEASQLTGEYGNTTRDYIWLGDLPIAVVDTAAGVSTVSYVHADGLGTPRAVTDATGASIWQFAYQGNAFGEQQPLSASGYTYNLRFPGQYFDAESGLVYNIARSFEPATGRFVESDPTGIQHSQSTYAYVDDNPLIAFDPNGKAKIVQGRAGDASTIVCDGLGGISVYLSPQITFDQMACWGDCTRAHEMVHRQQYLKANPAICANQSAFSTPRETSKVAADADEIAAYKAQIDCLKAKLRDIKDCDKCKEMIQHELQNEENLLRNYEYEYENLPRI